MLNLNPIPPLFLTPSAISQAEGRRFDPGLALQSIHPDPLRSRTFLALREDLLNQGFVFG